MSKWPPWHGSSCEFLARSWPARTFGLALLHVLYESFVIMIGPGLSHGSAAIRVWIRVVSQFDESRKGLFMGSAKRQRFTLLKTCERPCPSRKQSISCTRRKRNLVAFNSVALINILLLVFLLFSMDHFRGKGTAVCSNGKPSPSPSSLCSDSWPSPPGS